MAAANTTAAIIAATTAIDEDVIVVVAAAAARGNLMLGELLSAQFIMVTLSPITIKYQNRCHHTIKIQRYCTYLVRLSTDRRRWILILTRGRGVLIYVPVGVKYLTLSTLH